MSTRADRRIDVPSRKPIVDGLGIACWQWNLESNSVDYSDEWKRIRGLAAVTISNAPEERLSRVHPDDVADLELHRHKLIRGECEFYEFDHRVRHSDGSWIWVAERCRAVREGRKTVRLIGCDVEITQRKQEELDLKQSQQRFNALADAIPAAIVQNDADGQLTYVNGYWSVLTGRPVEAAFGDGWQKVLHPEDLPKILQHLYEVREGPPNEEIVFDAVEARHVNPDGSTKWFQPRVRARYGADGKLTDVTAVLIDIHEKKKLNDRLQRVLECSSIGIWEHSFEDQTLTWDDQMLEIHGIESGDFRGTHEDWTDRLHPDDFDRMMEAETELQANEGVSSHEYRIVRPNGDVRHVYANVYVECNEQGQPVRTIGINMDITDRRQAELAFQETETKFQRIAENVPGVFRYVLHPDGTHELAYASAGFCELFEVEPEEAIGAGINNVWDRIHVDDRDQLGEEVAAAAKKLEPLLAEFRLNLTMKGVRWVQTHAQPIRAANGDVISDGVVLDHTERKVAQLTLQESQAQFQRMTENVPGMNYRYIQRPDGSHAVTYVGSKCRDLFEVEPEEAMENADVVFARVHPEDLPKMLDSMQESAQSLQQTTIDSRVLLPKRGERWLRCISQPTRNEDGVITWDGVITDVTDEKAVQLALQESQTQFQRMTENVPDMIYRYTVRPDGSHAMLYVSAQCRELYEIEPEEALEDADKLFTCLHPDDVERVTKAVQASAKNLTSFVEEFRVIMPKKGLCWRQTIAQPSRTKDGDTIWDGVVFDYTDRKQAELKLQLANEELARATKLKDEFLANMSHELRTPLNAILGMSEGLQDGIYGPITQEQKRSFDVIQQSGGLLLDLINEVLDLAKIESGSVKLEISAVDIPKLCESSLRLIRQQADKKGIDLSLNVASNLPNLAADEKRIRQVLVNLLSNAVKFTPERGNVSVDVQRISNDATDEDVLRISVADTGIGIEPDHLESLFQPFVQVDSSLSRSFGGTGLGLALVKRFVELHKGHVSVTSEPDVGSTFTVDLPWRQVNIDASLAGSPKQVAPANNDPKPNASQLTNTTVLLAEDNEYAALATTKYLESLGHQVVLVTNGLAAVEAVQQSKPDIILMDVQMPVMDGLEAIERIRALPDCGAVPIIALTGLAMPEDASRCLSAGANKYLSKPYRMGVLVDSLRELLPTDANRT